MILITFPWSKFRGETLEIENYTYKKLEMELLNTKKYTFTFSAPRDHAQQRPLAEIIIALEVSLIYTMLPTVQIQAAPSRNTRGFPTASGHNR